MVIIYTKHAIEKLHRADINLRVIYDIIGEDIKIITFHISRKGRYK